MSEKEKKINDENIIVDNANNNGSQEEFFTAIGHDVRRKIITIIGENEFVGFSIIKKEVGGGTGTIYHHIKQLGNLIEQDRSKKYHLTDLGKRAYSVISQDLNSPQESSNNDSFHPQQFTFSLSKKYSEFLQFKRIVKLYDDYEDKHLDIIVSFLIILTCAVISSFYNFHSYIFFFFSNTSESIIPIKDANTISFNPIIFISVIVGYLFLFIIIEVLIRKIFKIQIEPLKFLSYLGISYIPMLFNLLYLIANFYFNDLSFLRIPCLLIFQVWAMIILSNIISYVKNIQFERALIISVFINYLTFMIVLSLEIL